MGILLFKVLFAAGFTLANLYVFFNSQNALLSKVWFFYISILLFYASRTFKLDLDVKAQFSEHMPFSTKWFTESSVRIGYRFFAILFLILLFIK